MKKIISTLVVIMIIFTSNVTSKVYASESTMQVAWLATVWGIDWPKSKNIQTQKQEMINILDTLKETGINTVMFQVRPKGDALYKSSINPWSDVLTGTQGKDPGYDPLEFVIQEAKKRGMKVHAWLNPYRVTHEGDHKNGTVDTSVLSDNHPAKLNNNVTLAYGNKLYYNPESEWVKQHISDTVAEIVRNYDVDGIVFDDYFYPTNYPLPEGESRDGAVANARREHINQMILKVKNTIKSIKTNVKFGVSPFGIWKNSSSDPMGSNTSSKATESYYAHSADTVKWIKEGYIDYVIPQIYWDTNHSLAPYKTLTEWWANIVKGTNVDLYIGHNTTESYSKCANEIDEQIKYSSKYSSIKGNVYYNTTSLMKNVCGARDKIKNTINSNTQSTIKFNDLSNNHWAYDEIIEFAQLGIVNGFGDRTFGPDNSITRAQFIKIFNKYFELTKKSGKSFSDSTNHWAKEDIDIAYTNGIIDGFEDGTFRPDDAITREAAAKIIANYKKISDKDYDKLNQYNDSYNISNWAKDSIEAILENGYMNGFEDKTFRPKENLTRAQAVVMLSRIN